MSPDSAEPPNQPFYDPRHPAPVRFWSEYEQLKQAGMMEQQLSLDLPVYSHPLSLSSYQWSAQPCIEPPLASTNPDYPGSSDPVSHPLPNPALFSSHCIEPLPFTASHTSQGSYFMDPFSAIEERMDVPPLSCRPHPEQYAFHSAGVLGPDISQGPHPHQWQIQGPVAQDARSTGPVQDELTDWSSAAGSTSTTIRSSRETTPDMSLPTSSEVSLHVFPRHNMLTQLFHSKLPVRYVCHICGALFMRRHDGLRHLRKHTGETRYTCNGCDQGFIRSEGRLRHWAREPSCYSKHSEVSATPVNRGTQSRRRPSERAVRVTEQEQS